MEWNENLNTGVELLDRQHKDLLASVAELRRLGGRGSLLKSAQIMDALRVYVTVHFATEEDLMRQCGYPDLAAHAAEHRAFVGHLDALMQENVRHDNTGQLVEFFEHWLENHLCHADMKYVPYLVAAAGRDKAG